MADIFEKLFGAFSPGSGKIQMRSNIKGSSGFRPIGTTDTKIFNIDRESPLLGHANPSSNISGYYDRLLELKGYQLLDIVKLATNFFSDYIVNFLSDDSGSSTQVVTVLNEDGSNNEQVTERLNKILLKDINIFKYIKDHINDYVYYGQYYSMLTKTKDDTGHTTFRVEELLDPSTVIGKKKLKNGEEEEVFLAKSEDGEVYEIPKNSVIYLALQNLRLKNDIGDKRDEKNKKNPLNNRKQEVPFVKNKQYLPFNFLTNTNSSADNKYVLKDGNSVENNEGNRRKVLCNEYYFASEPLFYSLILKIKELVIKEILVSLISLRDLSSVQIFLLQFDKSTPLENANDTCARAQKLTNNTNELASFLSSEFDAISFIENTMTQSAKFIPDYGSTIGAKNAMLPMDKLSDKILDIMQTIDQCKASILGPLGLPITITDSSSGSKWQVLQQSERANSRVSSFLDGIKSSILSLVMNIYETIYSEEIDPSLIKLHINEKTSVEYNNQINQSESINGLLQGINQILSGANQTYDMALPLLDPQAFGTYIRNLIKDIDPATESIITDQTINDFVTMCNGKKEQMMSQYDMGGGEDQMQMM